MRRKVHFRACLSILAAVVCSSSSLFANASDYVGLWRYTEKTIGGVDTYTYLDLEERDGKLRGRVIINEAMEVPLDVKKVNEKEAVFTISWGAKFKLVRLDDGMQAQASWFGADPLVGPAIRVKEVNFLVDNPIPLPEIEEVPSNGLVQTPPMGWNSWNYFSTSVTDEVIRGIADAMVESGMADAGYEYIVIDDGWQGWRDEEGNLIPNEKFPDMKALADYVHSKGLKFGIYSSPGKRTCGGYIGSYGYEEQDAMTFASWGVDYLKYDWCGAQLIYGKSQEKYQAGYQKMARALMKTGRPIVYSVCQYGEQDVWKWGKAAGGNLWRTTGDIHADWGSVSYIGFSQNGLEPYAEPGHWNDPDMLQVGNGDLTWDENKTHFTLWCMLAAPLMAGNDLRNMPETTTTILTNKDLIAINQDSLGQQGRRILQQGGIEVWSKPLQSGQVAVAIFNRDDAPRELELSWAELGLSSAPESMHDVWAGKVLEVTGGGKTFKIPTHGVVLLKAD